MALAYPMGEDLDHAVPIDVIEIRQVGEKKSLFLPKGTHTLILKDKSGHKKLEVNIQ